MEIIKYKINFKDERGEISDLLENKNINSITKINMKKGAVRGNHYHEKTIQYVYVISGKIEIHTQIDDNKPEATIFIQGDLSATVPFEKHAIKAIEDSEFLVFTEGPRAGSGYETDTFRLDKKLI